MKIPIATIDSFTESRFSGNPAAVCLLDNEISDLQMQLIAREMNLSETAFVNRLEGESQFSLRWFTPLVEVDLCGHATLASAFCMLKSSWVKIGETINFQTKSGELRVKNLEDQIEMNFPLITTEEQEHPYFTEQFMGAKVVNAARLKGNWIIEVASVVELINLVPDFQLISEHSDEGIIVTAADKGEFDLKSRYFAPNLGVNEDPVTGFAHCALMDYWYKKTGKSQLKAYQASKRGGELNLRKEDHRVVILGKAVEVLKGYIEV